MFEKFPTKPVVVLIVTVAIGVSGYFWLVDGDDIQSALEITNTESNATSTPESVDTEEILAQLNRLKKIDMNTEIFNSDTYFSFEDFGIRISEQSIGRENPFLQPAANTQGGIIIPNPISITGSSPEIEETSSSNNSDTDDVQTDEDTDVAETNE
jgi:hypothetical protein